MSSVQSSSVIIDASLRTNVGTGASRAARRSGMIPAVLYGRGECKSIVLDAADFAR